MIAWKTLKQSGTGVITFDERLIGGSGGQSDWGGYRIDATDNQILVRLPKVSLCEGRVISFITVNPNARGIQIATPASSGERIVILGTESSGINNSADFGQVTLSSDGVRWYAETDGSFT